MQVARDLAQARRVRAREAGASWGLVPTMGFLHAGHLELVRRSRSENDRTAVSVFVNPAQFGETRDFENYPRALERDLTLLEEAGVDLVFAPADVVLYPPGFQTWVTVEDVSQPLEGASRPGHFRGVATVLTKLFNLLTPDRAYFGQKDVQQTVVVTRLVRDLDFALEVVVCPTVREADGLAMSSRNARLTPAERAAAPVVYRALEAAAALVAAGERDAETLRRTMRETLAAEPLARLDYVSVADPGSLAELVRVEHKAILSLATCFGEVRLIDNLPVEAASPEAARGENP